MTTIDYPTPVYKLWLYTTEYTSASMIGSGISATQDTTEMGWLVLDSTYMPVKKYNIDDNMRAKSIMNFTVNEDDYWLFQTDIVVKYDDNVYYPKGNDGNPLTSDGSLLIVHVLEGDYTIGTVTISGTTTENGAGDDETLTINGAGSYVTTKHFESIDASGVEDSGLNTAYAVWGSCDLPERRRELRFYVDGNDDGYYGLIFAGYIVDSRHNPVYGDDNINLVAHDYTEFQMANEFHSGYRCYYRCANFEYDGTAVTCSEIANTVGWFAGYCKTGDMHPVHPDGTEVTEDDALYSCSYYVADTSHPLHFDGYTYMNNYAPDTDQQYNVYPKCYTRAQQAIAKCANHIEQDRSVSTFTLDGAMTNSSGDTALDVDYYYGRGLSVGDIVTVDDEKMQVTDVGDISPDTTYSGTTTIYNITVTRGVSSTTIAAHTDNTQGTVVIERDTKSCQWQPATKTYFQLKGSVTDSATTIYVDNVLGIGIETDDYILVGTEFMKVTSSTMSSSSYYNGTATQYTLGVTRECLGTTKSAYADDVWGYHWYISSHELDVTGESGIIIESDVGATLFDCGTRQAETMMMHTTSREVVYWIDFYRQLHLMQVNEYDPAYSSSLSLSDDDVLAVEGLGIERDGIVNHVRGVVSTVADGEYACEMSSDEIDIVDKSIALFGRISGTLDTKQMNVVGYDNRSGDYRGFATAAGNYLSTHAFPIAKQTIVMRNFYPSEMYWNNTDNNNHTDLNYTDPYNEYIDVKGHQITCDDYNFVDRPSQIWTIERIRYESDQYGDSTVKLTLTRLTTESDFE